MKEKLEAAFKFRPGLVPSSRTLIYQLVDIEVDEVQNILKQDPLDRDEISEKDGWFANGTIEKIRSIMNDVVSETLAQQAGAGDESDAMLVEVVQDEDSMSSL